MKLYYYDKLVIPIFDHGIESVLINRGVDCRSTGRRGPRWQLAQCEGEADPSVAYPFGKDRES